MPPLLYTLFVLIVFLGDHRSAAATDTISPGDVHAGEDRLVSNNGKFALGFFKDESSAAPNQNKWFLGIWFNIVPNLTTVWVANGGDPIMAAAAAATSPELTISGDGDLVALHPTSKSVIWSTQAAKNSISNNIAAVLLNTGNLVLLDNSNLSETRTLWQSFDYPTDTLLPGAKLGRDKLTGLNRHLISKKSMADPSPGAYCFAVDSNTPQLVLKICNSSITYWSSGAWNGQYFSGIPELIGNSPGFHLGFFNNSREEYLQFNVSDDAVVTRNFIDVNGQNKQEVWLGSSQGWLTLYSNPKVQCDVYGLCGAFSVCSFSLLPLCSCMKGFTVRSVKDWEQGDQTGGCVRNNQLDCGSSNNSAAASTDKFYTMSGVILPDKAERMQDVGSSDECSKACLNNCSCTAYSYGSKGCLVWHTELLNAKQQQNNDETGSNGEIMYLRLSARDMKKSNKRRVTIGVVVGACSLSVLVYVVVLFIIRRNKNKNRNQNCGNLVAFRYKDLRSATKNFSEKIGEGGFGSVFKGQLRDSTGIAVKRLDGRSQGEKQFRAEVRSIGTIQHINLVNLIGFCSDGDSRFLVYEHMPNRSLDTHLFQSNGKLLDWSTRYQIALGVARGLCYLHESCYDRIIHCDIKPQNVLLDALFIPKIADFGMAKFAGRDFSRVLTTMRGTLGYLAPEWISGTAITPKVDVYSYGMVLLELVSGRRNSARSEEFTTAKSTDTDGNYSVYFPMQASQKLLDGDVMSLLDQRLSGDADIKEVAKVCKIACWCIQDDEVDRPTMGQVVQILEGVLDCDMPPLPRLIQRIFERPSSVSSTSFSLFVSSTDSR
uniref:Receptor-like serine/threonine-protein kinase n=1 Tax=Leersia perrieri TaxID=77586 RepID=A0A0D9UWX5_9ORYZ